LIIFGINIAKEIGNMQRLVVVIDSSNVLRLRTSLSVASVAENTWCSLFNVEDRILVEILYKFKGYRAKKIVNFLT